jgi:Ras-related protein Rab-1A
MSSTERDYDYIAKILLVGNVGAGKSCLLSRYCDNEFNIVHQTTIGVDFKVRTIELDSGKVVKMQIWDTAGQERFRTITTSYYRGAHGVFIVFDLTNEASFAEVEKWNDEINSYTPYPIPKIVIGNKLDLPRVVTYDRAKSFADALGLEYVETSAKYPQQGCDLNNVFSRLCQDILEKDVLQPYKRKPNLPPITIGTNLPTADPTPSNRCGC